ncbi:M43 family zinc metalloprotease [Flavobacterium sp.]|uniref:M43 family zinc metalloprotease n=1 Tax=Flavobacterium sp. TaxID=239 RepID=UPI0025B88D05|nr:M43 family zinc metalloprotease [Flavobacterium sp.]
MKKQLLLLVLCCLWIAQGIRAQDLIGPSHSCRTKEVNELQLKNHPGSLKENKAFNLFSKEYAKKRSTGKSSENTTYIIPVVFHVYGTSFNGKTVTLQKIQAALKNLNDDFKGLNDDFNTVEPFFQARRGTLNIEFRLAQIDPSGKCTTGVIFERKKDGYGNGGGYDNQIQADAWDNYKYMNVYIQNDLYADGATNNSGVCWYPDSWMSDNNLARCVYNGAYLGENTNKEFAAVLTHEFGHFLNLIHTFDGGCSGTDEVDDTPKEDGKHSLGCVPGTNCDGDKVNIENYMGYNAAQGCSKMFTQGQVTRMLAALQHPARRTLWTAQNLTATGVNTTGSSLVSDITSFKEDVANNGTISGSANITLSGTTFTKSTGTLTSGVDFSANLPVGLSATITINSNSQATVTITGTATAHNASNTTTGGITLLAPALTGGVSGMLCDGLSWNFKFRDPYGIFFVDIPDMTVTPTSTWKYFTIEKGDDPKYGVWRFAANHLKVETYGKRLITNTGTNNITALGFNTAINASSNFTAPGAYPNQLDLRTSSYKAWDGKTDYFGFEYTIDGEKCYGWLKAVVAADGSGYTIVEYAYNTQPGGTIYTGMTDKVALSVSPAVLSEAAVNNGSVSQTSSFKLTTNNGTFVKNSGELTPGVDYTISGVPAGLSAKLNVISNTEVQLAFTGNAVAHLKENSATIAITFLNPAITGGVATLSSSGTSVKINFRDPYAIVHVKDLNYTVDAANTWKFFRITADADQQDYGVFVDKGDLKLETYTKSIVCEGNSLNMTLIGANQLINGSSNFVEGGSYPNLHTLRNASYKSWDGKTGYIGFTFTIAGEACYGWFKVKVNAKGTAYTLLEYAYNTEPGAGINTEDIPVDLSVHLANTPDEINENAMSNDGSFDTKVTIQLTTNGGTFTKSSGSLVQGTDFTVTGLPAGLTAEITVLNSTTAELSYTGKATANEASNTTTATITFLNPAITGGAAILDSDNFTTKFNFKNAYRIIYVDMPTPLTVSVTGSKWIPFNISAEADNASYGLFVEGSDLKLENYNKDLVCESGINNISYLGYNVTISGASNWNGTRVPTLRSSSYKVWDGKKGYIGFKYTKDGHSYYGYFETTVSADGQSYTIDKYAYNTAPEGSITTPALFAHISNVPASISEDVSSNNGTFGTTVALTIDGGTFAKSQGNLVEGTDYTIAGLPSGLTASITITSSTTAQVTYSGKAVSNDLLDAATATVTFLDPAITGGVAKLDVAHFTTDFTYIDAYKIIYVDLPAPLTVAVGGTTWNFFRTTADADNADYGLFVEGSSLKLETYNKELVCEAGGNNISYVGYNTTIDGTNNWNGTRVPALRSSTYTVWDGKTGFIGFKYAKNGVPYYGYFEAVVSADGQSYSISKYAYNTAPNAAITTPIQLGMVKMTNTPAVITEDAPTNDGRFLTAISVSLTTNGGTFTKNSGNLTEGTDFTVTGLPAGLTTDIAIVNNTTAKLTYIGKATANEAANATVATITFLDAAITGGAAVLENKSFTTGFTFINGYTVVKVDLPAPIIVSASNPSGSFRITAEADGNETEFKLQYGENGLKFLTNNGLVSETGTNSISFIGTNQTIGGSNNWNSLGDATISSAAYNNWNGKTGFIGFTFVNSGVSYYGYFEAAVSADGKSFAVIRYAYSAGPQALITTPATVNPFTFPTLGTVDFETKVSYTQYPNPFNEAINISSASFSGKKVQVLIYNALGQNMFTKSYDASSDMITIDGSSFTNGFYFLKVTVDGKVQAVKKIMK